VKYQSKKELPQSEFGNSWPYLLLETAGPRAQGNRADKGVES